MGTQPTTKKGEPTSGRPAESQAICHMAGELLKAGQYKRVAELLHEAQTASERAGYAILADILAAARRISLALAACQAEVERHQRAYEEVGTRERELRQQLHNVLDLISRREAPEAPETPERPPSPVLERETSVEKGKQEEQAPPSLAVYCLGPFRVYQDDELITDWPSGKGKCIFKYMIARRGRPVPKDVLMDIFWRSADPEAARNNLNVAIYGLRQAFRAARPDFSHILFQDDCYLLSPALAVWVDVEEFLQHYEDGQSFERRGMLAEAIREYEVAEGLYQGDFLVEDLYQDWCMLQREGLKDRLLVILDRLSRYYLEEGRYATCIHLCQKMLAKDDCREDAYRRLMRCYSRQGQRYVALRQYHLCVEALARVLDVSPMEDTVALYHKIRHGEED